MIRNIPIASLHQKFMEILNYTKPLYMRVQFFHALLVISELVGEMNQGYIFKSKMPTFHIYVFNAVFVVSKIARRID